MNYLILLFSFFIAVIAYVANIDKNVKYRKTIIFCSLFILYSIFTILILTNIER